MRMGNGSAVLVRSIWERRVREKIIVEVGGDNGVGEEVVAAGSQGA